MTNLHVSVLTLLGVLPLAVACGSSPSTDGDSASTPSAECTSAASCQGVVATVDGLAVNAACVGSNDVPAAATCVAHATPPDAVDDALSQVGLDRCTFSHTVADLGVTKLDVTDGRQTPDMLAQLMQPMLLPGYGESLTRDFDAAMASDMPVARAIVAAATRRGTVPETCDDPAFYSVAVGDAAPLKAALRDVGAPEADVSGVPRDLQVALAPIVRTFAAAARDVQAARHANPDVLRELESAPSWMIGVRHFELTPALVASFDAVDADAMARAAIRVAIVVERAKLARFAGVAIPDVAFETPFGRVVLAGPGDHVHAPGGPADGAAFVLDTGGKDRWLVPAGASSVSLPVSVAVDLGGDDTYAYPEVPVDADSVGRRLPSDGAGRLPDGRTLSRTPRQGAGVLGVGLLFDLGASSDTYRSLLGSQGAATNGVGVLFDQGGDDTYDAEGFAQGAGAWGVGLLVDLAGSDTRRLYVEGQGYGFTHGLGAIVDAAGDDKYVAYAGTWDGAPATLASDLLYPSAQLPGPPATPIAANMNFAQGCGAGHRPDWPDPGFPSPGGVGVLYDASGNDSYGGGVFAQGVGFLEGTGLLVDGHGNDAYDALYYMQGASAHLGLSLFDDREGNDLYDTHVPAQAAGLGMATDLAAAIHLDRAGDDTYAAPDIAMGMAEDDALAMTINAGGDDSFAIAGDGSLGSTGLSVKDNTRRKLPTVGVFVKGGGASHYVVGGESKALSGKSWKERHGDGVSPAEKGSGVDRPNGSVSL